MYVFYIQCIWDGTSLLVILLSVNDTLIGYEPAGLTVHPPPPE